jgi:hypothetical protein
MQRILAAALFALFAFVTPSQAQDANFKADSLVNVTSTIAANNTTAIVITTSRAAVYSIDAFNNSTTLAYVKLYNGAATCGSGTPRARYMIPFGTSSAGGGFNLSNINGDSYVNGITMCITTGIADSDTGAPAASTYIVNLHWAVGSP